jgi:lysophospholipase L1-like esterase
MRIHLNIPSNKISRALKICFLSSVVLFFVSGVQAEPNTLIKKVFKVSGGEDVYPLNCPSPKKTKILPKALTQKKPSPSSGTVPAGQENIPEMTEEEIHALEQAGLKAPSEDEIRKNQSNAQLLSVFHEALKKGIDSRGVARVGLWGGSHMAAEFFPVGVRQALQDKYGVAGPGHINLLAGRAGIRIPDATLCKTGTWRDGLAPRMSGAPVATVGLGLFAMTSTSAHSTFELALKNQSNGSRPNKLNLQYLQHPDGGSFELIVDGKEIAVIQTDGPLSLASIEISGDKPISTLKVMVRESLNVTFFGLYAEGPKGVVLDNFGIAGASGNYWNTVQLDTLKTLTQVRPYDAVILAYGTNDVTGKTWDPDAYKQKFQQTLTSMRTVFPKAACILIPPGDRVGFVQVKVPSKKKIGKSKYVIRSRMDFQTYPTRHAEAAEIQRVLGLKNQCLVWNMSLEMRQIGGAYGMLKEDPALMAKDLIHLTPKGYSEMAKRFNQYLDLPKSH